RTNDQSHPVPQANVGARPGGESRNAISEANEKKYVGAHPCQPRKKSAPVRSKRPENLSNRCLPPDRRNVTFIEVAEAGKVLDDRVLKPGYLPQRPNCSCRSLWRRSRMSL